MSDQAKQLSADELRERAEVQRSSLKQTAEALGERLRASSEPVQHAISEVKTRARRAGGFVREHHWAFIGASMFLGTVLGVRGGRRRRRRRQRDERLLLPPAAYDREYQHELAEETGREVGKRGAVGAFAGMMLGRVGSALAREAAGIALARYEQWRHDRAMQDAMAEGAFMGGEPAGPDDARGASPYAEHLQYPGR